MKSAFHVRVDNRLLHGQVVQFWIPHLGVENLIVADDEVASSDSLQTIYRMALPKMVALDVVRVKELKSVLEHLPPLSNMVLIRSVASIASVVNAGADISAITIGNVHAAPFRTRVTDAVYLSDEETEILCRMTEQGIRIEIQTFPGEVLRFQRVSGGGRWSRY
jgi:mannose/fructose/N-acetylgalactosamine-specific phosphotransferase system component IIB